MKKSEKEKAIKLRKDGYSYNMIVEQVQVSKSTLYHWLSEIPYKPNEEVEKRIGRARARSGEVKHQMKLANLALAKELAKADLKRWYRNGEFMFGLALYAGEGEKNDTVGIINSNPKIIVFCIKWLKEFYAIKTSNLTLAIHCYPDNNIATCLRYWSDVTGIPKNQFGKTQVDKRRNKKLGKRAKLQYGTAHLRVKSNGDKQLGVLLSRRILASIDLMLEK